MKQFWIQKGTPDIIVDSLEEMEESFSILSFRENVPWIHVVDFSELEKERSLSDEMASILDKLSKEDSQHLDSLDLINGVLEKYSNIRK